MKTNIILLFALILIYDSAAQNITLSPVPGEMVCGVQVPGLRRQSFALGVPETIGATEGMLLNFPEVRANWSAPDQNGMVSHCWQTIGKIEYSVKLWPYQDYVDLEMTIKNLGHQDWTQVFAFNCLNPVNAPKFQDWNLVRTYMSQNGKPLRMDGTTRINTGAMKTVQFYLHEKYTRVSPFVSGFGAISPDKTDDSYILTLSEDSTAYMAATSPGANFLFSNLDRCCIHSATDFGDIAKGEQRTVISRFYFARGNLNDFLVRFHHEIKSQTRPRIAMCWGRPWELADTTQWNYVYHHIDVFKFYIGDILNATGSRVDSTRARLFVKHLVTKGIKIAVENGGLLDWYADKGDQAAQFSFNEDYQTLKTLIRWIKAVDPSKSIDILDLDHPLLRMLYPNDEKKSYHTLQSAAVELFKLVKMWREAVPGIELNLLSNFPNWAWGNTPAYYELFGSQNGYGHYQDELNAVQAESERAGLKLDGFTIDNPYDYATGKASSNQPAQIQGVDWMKRIKEVGDVARAMGLTVNMIFNTNGSRTAQGYSEQTLAFIDLYHAQVGTPDGYWIQSWYQMPEKWLPETENYTMTNLTMKAIQKLHHENPPRKLALLEPEDGKVYHGAGLMTFEIGPNPIAPYLAALNDSTIQPAVRGFFMSIPGERGPALPLAGLKTFFHAADSIGFIPELSLFLVGKVGTEVIATDSIIAVSSQYDWIIDSLITLSQGYGKSMFLRIGGEFNGSGPGWNGGGCHPYLYVTMFRKIVDRFQARGFRDSIAVNWCYEPDAPNDFDSVDVRGARWYPGDAYVDWFGLDVFDVSHFDQSLPDYNRRGITPKGKSERFLALARERQKPVFISETSAKGVNISPDALDGINDWNSWFAKFWHFVGVHPGIKGFCYLNANWPESAYPGWGDARIGNNAYVAEKYRAEMHRPQYLHLPIKGTTAIGLNKNSPFPGSISLNQNYPNPFNPITTISWYLGRSGQVKIEVFDILGRKVKTLLNTYQAAGNHTIQLDAGDLPSGVYYYQLKIDDRKFSKKMLLVR